MSTNKKKKNHLSPSLTEHRKENKQSPLTFINWAQKRKKNNHLSPSLTEDKKEKEQSPLTFTNWGQKRKRTITSHPLYINTEIYSS
jgi:hypothetical protein